MHSQADRRGRRRPRTAKRTAQHESLFARLHRALGPILGGLILDFVDIVTFVPIGLFGGFLVGGLVGWWIATLYEFSPRGRAFLAILAALYTPVPLTEPLPIATAVGAVARFRQRKTISRWRRRYTKRPTR